MEKERTDVESKVKDKKFSSLGELINHVEAEAKKKVEELEQKIKKKEI